MRAVVLCMPDISPHFFDDRWKLPGAVGPMLAANITRHEIVQADLVTQRTRVPDAIAEVVRKYRPAVVGLSAMSFQYYSACRTAEIVRRLDPSIRVGLGGYHATTSFEAIAASPEGGLFDFMVRGEGEATFGEYLDRLEDGQPAEQVDGLSFRDGDQWVHNPPRACADLGGLKPPTRQARIWKNFGYLGRRIDVIESSRGCTVDCSFCSITQMYGRTFRTFPIDSVLASIEDARRHKANFLIFSDDNLGVDVSHLLRVCRAIVEHKQHDLLYLVQLPPRLFVQHPEAAEALAAAGVRIVFLGMESIDEAGQQALGSIRKTGPGVEELRQAIELLRARGIHVLAGVILGLPHETPENMERHFRWCREQQLVIADQIVCPYPGTRQRRECVSGGYLASSDVRRYDGFWANVRSDWMSPWELEYWRWYHYRRYVTLMSPPPTLKAVSPAAYYALRFLLRPARWLSFMLQDPVQNFERYQRRTGRVNDVFGGTYPDLFTSRSQGGKRGTLDDRAAQRASDASSPGRGA